MFWTLFVATQFLFVSAQYRFDCYEGFCAQSSCPELHCKEGRLIKNATRCGCCHVCVLQLKEGAKCKTLSVGQLPTEECGPGLKCDAKTFTCVPADTNCIQDQIKFDYDMRIGNILNIKNRPVCDEFGYYTSFVCIADVLCYCVNKHGQRVFGTDFIKNKDSMNCKCSQDYDEFPKKVATGNFPRCLPNGNYAALQCTEKWCYCMGDSFNNIGTVIQANTTIKDLLCYDEKLHKDDDSSLRSKCWHKRNLLLAQITEYENNNITVIGVDLPQCDLDGSYAPVQCKKDICYCVSEKGEFYNKYKVRRNSEAARKMDCKCAREKEILQDFKDDVKVQKFLKNHPCDFNGNYREMY